MHLKNSFLIIIIILVFGENNKLFSQRLPVEKYVVFIFREKNIQNKEVNEYTWITPIDTIDRNFVLYPFYIDLFSKDNIDNCCIGDSVDIFTMTTKTSYDYEKGYLYRINRFKTDIYKNKKLIQKVKKEWKDKIKIEVKIYATAIDASLCYCYDEINSQFVYIPYSDFSIFEKFWKTENAKFIIWHDYANILYRNKP